MKERERSEGHLSAEKREEGWREKARVKERERSEGHLSAEQREDKRKAKKH